jgi:Fibronectin type III domain
MAWNASTDNSGNFSYRVRLWGDPTVVTLPKTQASYTWTGLRPGVQYHFWVEAVDGSGNKSTSDPARRRDGAGHDAALTPGGPPRGDRDSL